MAKSIGVADLRQVKAAVTQAMQGARVETEQIKLPSQE